MTKDYSWEGDPRDARRDREKGQHESAALVSVIIPCYNQAHFLGGAIESVFAQTYENWELLLIDDGSTDSSTQVAQQYAEQYPEKVRYLEHPGHQNRGISASRNLGVSPAKGEYVAFLDADDVWLPHKLEQQVAILESNPEASMLYGNTQRWHSWTGNPEDSQRDCVQDLLVQVDTLFKPPTLLTLSYPLGQGTAPSLSNLMLRREVVERVGGFEERFRGMYEDQAFLIKVYLKEPVFVASESEYWDKYRQHPDSCVAAMERTGQYHSVRLFFLDWLAKYLSEQGLEDTEVWKLLQGERLIVQVRLHRQKGEWKQIIWKLLVLLSYYPRALIVRARRKLRHTLRVSR